jgi:hypothetical protein
MGDRQSNAMARQGGVSRDGAHSVGSSSDRCQYAQTAGRAVAQEVGQGETAGMAAAATAAAAAAATATATVAEHNQWVAAWCTGRHAVRTWTLGSSCRHSCQTTCGRAWMRTVSQWWDSSWATGSGNRGTRRVGSRIGCTGRRSPMALTGRSGECSTTRASGSWSTRHSHGALSEEVEAQPRALRAQRARDNRSGRSRGGSSRTCPSHIHNRHRRGRCRSAQWCRS